MYDDIGKLAGRLSRESTAGVQGGETAREFGVSIGNLMNVEARVLERMSLEYRERGRPAFVTPNDSGSWFPDQSQSTPFQWVRCAAFDSSVRIHVCVFDPSVNDRAVEQWYGGLMREAERRWPKEGQGRDARSQFQPRHPDSQRRFVFHRGRIDERSVRATLESLGATRGESRNEYSRKGASECTHFSRSYKWSNGQWNGNGCCAAETPGKRPRSRLFQ